MAIHTFSHQNFNFDLNATALFEYLQNIADFALINFLLDFELKRKTYKLNGMNRITVWTTLCFNTFHAKREPQAKRSSHFNTKTKPIPSVVAVNMHNVNVIVCVVSGTHISRQTQL